MNTNRVVTDSFSNPDSEMSYKSQWPTEPELLARYENGEQCGGCAFFAPFNADWGLCCNPESRHHLETIFEHFTCAHYADESWGAHSFQTVTVRAAIDQLERESRTRWEDLKKRVEAKRTEQPRNPSE